MRSDKKYENPELNKKLSQIKKSKSSTENSGTADEFEKYDLANNERNIAESCTAWIIIVFVCIVVLRIIFANFRIPFDYDPNFKNKYTKKRKLGNKKYNFQKR